MADQITVTQDVSKLLDKIKGVKCTILTTLDARNRLCGRPVYTCESGSDESLWFFSEKDTQTITEIRHNAQVGLGYSDPDKTTYVTIAGKAEVVDDRRKIEQLWHEDFRGFFPEGADDPNIALIKVTIENGEYWETPGNVLVRAFAYAKSISTGEKHLPTPNEQARVPPN